MAGPFEITGAKPQPTLHGYSPAYEYGGNLFVLALSFVDPDDSGSNPLLSIFKSEDAGETWTQVGTDVALASIDDTGFALNANAGFSTTVDVDDSSIVYACYFAPGAAIALARADLAAEDWGTEDIGPTIPTDGGSGGTPPMLAQASTGELAAIFTSNIDVVTATRLRAYFAIHSGGAWGSITQLDGQGESDETFDVAAIAAGADGRIHGFVSRQVGSDIDDTSVPDVCHVLLWPTPGTMETITTSATLALDGGRPIAEFDGSTLAVNVLRISESTLVGVETAHATSVDSPSFALSSLDAFDIAMFVDGGLRGVYNGGADLVQAAFSGSWGAPSAISDNAGVFHPYPRVVTGGLGIVFDDAVDLYYLTTAVSGGGGDVLTGETIPTAEEFFKTHGISGGGTVQCGGPFTAEPPEPGCNGNPGAPVDPGERNECPIDAGFSF